MAAGPGARQQEGPLRCRRVLAVAPDDLVPLKVFTTDPPWQCEQGWALGSVPPQGHRNLRYARCDGSGQHL